MALHRELARLAARSVARLPAGAGLGGSGTAEEAEMAAALMDVAAASVAVFSGVASVSATRVVVLEQEGPDGLRGCCLRQEAGDADDGRCRAGEARGA